MKINIVIPSTVLGGGVRQIFSYANALVERGWDVVIYVPGIYWPNREGFPNIKTSIANIFKRGTKVDWFDCKFPIKIATIVNNRFIRDADFTIATAWSTAKEVSMLNQKKGKKIYFIQDYEINKTGSDKDKVEATYKFGMNNVVIANWLKDIVHQVSGVTPFVLYNGIKDNEFIKSEKKINKYRKIIMIGNMAWYKGGKQGLQILEELKVEYNIVPILYGAGPIKNLPSDIEFYLRPDRKKLMQLYEEADICLSPSVREGWGLTVTEAMAHKCAIVGTNTGAIKELCVNNENALISKPEDYVDLKKNLIKLIKSDEKLLELQETAYKTALTLKESKQIDKLEEFLNKI